ncbi:helix-turn-helix domain-containing protein, partial [Enterococcus faecalis]|nr:helix-turn-helix domain-containing protein [Enterococcus faecalis]
MLSQSRIKDLNVLYQICITNTTTYTELNKITQIPIRTLKKIIDRLNTSIDDLFFLKDYINVSTKGEISIKPTEKINSFEILFRLRLHWYKTNQSFQLISLVLSERNLSKSKIIEKLFISETTLQRLLFKLNIYLKPFDFALAYKDGFLNFSGNEINIRLFLFQLNFFTYFNLEWPSSLSTIDSLEEDLVIFLEDFPTTQTDVKLRGALIWVALLKQRFQQNNFLIPNTNPEIKTILHEFKELNKLQSFNNLFFETIPPQEKITEELLLEFLVRIYVPDIDSCKEKEQLGRKFTNLNNTLTNSATRIIKALDKSLLIDAFDQSIYLRIFHLVFFMLINKVIGKS